MTYVAASAYVIIVYEINHLVNSVDRLLCKYTAPGRYGTYPIHILTREVLLMVHGVPKNTGK